MNTKLKKGSIFGGIAGIAISLLFIALVLVIFIKENNFTAWLVIAISVLVCFVILGISIVNLKNGLKSNEVKRLGSPSTGTIDELLTRCHYTNGSVYTSYYVVFQYNDANGCLKKSEEQISRKMYNSLSNGVVLPILVYKERAIINYEKMNTDNN